MCHKQEPKGPMETHEYHAIERERGGEREGGGT